MLLTYAALYFKDLIVALSRSPEHLQAVNIDTTAFKIDRSRLYFVYYCKQTERIIKGIILIVLGLVRTIPGLLVLIIGWALGIWAIATKSRLPYGPRVSAGVGFAVGLPAMIVIWDGILAFHEDRNKARKSGLIALPLYVHFGASISPPVRSPEFQVKFPEQIREIKFPRQQC